MGNAISMNTLVRRIVLFVGVVAFVVGAVGLITPVSVSPNEETVACGSAISPDLSAARAADDGESSNVPIPGGFVENTNFTRLCRMELSDRRIGTIVLAVAGALAIGGALVVGARSKRSEVRSEKNRHLAHVSSTGQSSNASPPSRRFGPRTSSDSE